MADRSNRTAAALDSPLRPRPPKMQMNGEAAGGDATTTAAPQSAKRALVVGINAYAPPNRLPSCVADAHAFASLLNDEFGFADIAIRTDEQATKQALLAALDALFAGAKAGDKLVFYFSGHGYRLAKDGAFDSVLVTQDSQFLTDQELADKLAGAPDGVLTVVLDACFSGGGEKMFVTREGSPEMSKVKRWRPSRDSDSPSEETPSLSDADVTPFGYLTPPTRHQLMQHLTPVQDKAFDNQPFRVVELQDRNSKGLLFSACLENEEATASTSQTNALSAFTFALTTAARELGASASARDLIAATGGTLRKLGLDQTPMLKEPLQPPHLADASFVLLNFASVSPSAGAEAAASSDPMPIIAALARLFLHVQPQVNLEGVKTMSNDATNIDGLRNLGDVGAFVVPMVSMMQGKGFSLGDALHIASAIAPLLLAKRNAAAQPDAKNWSSDVANVAQALQTLGGLLQAKAGQPQPAAKNFSLGDVISTIPTIVSLFAAQKPGGDSKDWSNDVANVAQALQTLGGLFQAKAGQPQPAAKDFSLGDVISTIPAIVSLFAAQKPGGGAKGWSDFLGGGVPPFFPTPPLFAQTSAASGKDWLTDLAAGAGPTVMTLNNLLQTANPASAQKGLSIGDIINVIGTVAQIAAQKAPAPAGGKTFNDWQAAFNALNDPAPNFQRAPSAQPPGKDWSDDARNVVNAVATIASLFQRGDGQAQSGASLH